jgi:threonine dehydrogenase-like Zn-dependent dehydrogenase
MKAIQLAEPKQFRVIDVPEPPAPGPGEAVVKVFRVGVCGTDYSGYLGKMPFFSYPRIPGHELGVEVVAVGPDVTTVKPGDRAAVEPYINCQRCYSCARGNVVVDATGSAKSMATAYNFVGFAGRLVWVGITQDQLAFTQPLMHRREMTFLASRNALAPEFTRIIRLIEAGILDTRPWVTHRAPFGEMVGEFANWLKPETGVVKAMVEVN